MISAARGAKTVKKIISVLMCAVVTACALPFCARSANAEQSKPEYNGYPVILVPGYASASLVYDENGVTKSAWGWMIKDIAPAILSNIREIFRSADAYVSRSSTNGLLGTVEKCLINLVKPMECNPDGTSKKQVRPVLFKARQTCDSYLNKYYPKGDYRVELDMTGEIDRLIGEENVFYFNCDFRMSAVDCAKDLDRYITDVKNYTGAQKVNIVAVSHGGLITAAYFALFPEKADVYNAVLNEPALGGAGLACDFMNGKFDFDEETFVKYLEYHSMSETDLNCLVKAHPLGFLDTAMEKIIPEIRKSLLYWGSIWDFLPADQYEKFKQMYLDPDESALLIEKSDFVHQKIMPEYKNIFKAAQSRGINVSIIAGTGNRIVTGQNSNSDGIIPIESSTGAKSAPFGKRFSDAYVAEAYSEKKSISPSMNVDATDCYLPDNTWFVNGLFHGMEFWDEYSRSLFLKLLLANEPINVHSDENYPRFYDTSCAVEPVHISVRGGGFISPDDNELTITNTSHKHTVYLVDIKADGIDIDFDIDFMGIKPGERRSVSFRGEIPDGISYAQITATYFMAGSLSPLSQRRQYFTAVKNQPQQPGSAGEFADAGYKTGFEQKASDKTVSFFKKTGLFDLASAVYDCANSNSVRLINLLNH